MAARAECTPGSPSLRWATLRHPRTAADFTTATPTRPRLRIPDVQARATSRPATSLPRRPRLHRCMAGMRAGIDIRTVRQHDIHGLPTTSAPPRLPGCVYQRRAAHSQGDVPPPQAPASAVPRSVHPAASPARCGAGAPRIADMPGNRSPWQESKTTPVRRHFRHTPASPAEPLPAAWRPTSGMSPDQVARHLEALLVLETIAARFGGRCGIRVIDLDRTASRSRIFSAAAPHPHHAVVVTHAEPLPPARRRAVHHQTRSSGTLKHPRSWKPPSSASEASAGSP